MTMLFMDSFDHYATAQLGLKYTTVAGSFTVGAVGRNSTNGALCPNTTGSGLLRKSITSAATIISGFAFSLSALPPSQDTIIFILSDAGTEQVSIRVETGTGKLKVIGAGTVRGTSTTALSLNTFYYIELKATIANSGSVELRINGTSEVNVSGVDTQTTANASADGVGLACQGNQTANYIFDDYYVCNGLGTVNNDFLGDLRVQAIFPDGAGGNTQWTPSANANWQNVDETTPNDDTDYNSDATVGDRDTYTYGNLSPATASIKAVQIMTYARKDDAGTRTIAPVVRLSAVNYDQASLPNLTTSYQYLPQVLETSPATTVAWTLSEVNGAEFGEKVIA